MATVQAKKLSRGDYTVGWICALSIELAASTGMLDEVHQNLDLVQGDKNMYTLGEIAGHNIVMACLPAGNMGITPAANVAANMLRSFPKIRFGVMVGIGGGAPARRARPNEDIRLGDVVVSLPQGELGGVVKYDRGKLVAGGKFQHTGLLNMPPTPLTNAVAKLRGIHETRRNAVARNVTAMINKVMESEDANPEFEDQYKRPDSKYDQLYQADYEHNEAPSEDGNQNSVDDDDEDYDDDDEDDIPLPCPHCDPTHLMKRKPRKTSDPMIHYGTIASADQVMRHAISREKIRKQYGVLCFEMEAAGLMNEFPCLVIRGICDYSDTHKHKIWQRYAAATAAAYTKELLGVVLKEDIEVTEEAAKVLERDKKREDRGRILQWLDADTHTKRYIDSYDKWQPSTMQWLLKSEQYLNWINRDTPTLWCHGIPGGGKTVFSSLIVHNLKTVQKNKPSEVKDAVICLFCEYDRHKNQTVRSLISAILRQLAEQCDVLPVTVTDLFDDHQDNDTPLQLEDITLVLTQVIQMFPRVFLIVDALDECSEPTRRELLAHLSDQQRKTGLKLLATSRSTVDFRKDYGACDELEIKADPVDVKNVVNIMIENSDSLVKRDAELRQRVTDNIALAVDGMFLLVQPFLDSIIGQRAKGYVEDALKALMESPDKISTVYEGALNRIGGQKPGDRKLAHRMLSWVIESKRPLSREEFQHALAVTIGSLKFRKDYIIDDLDGAVGLCAGLIVINQQSDTVQLMHHTTRTYFEEQQNRPDWMTTAPEMMASSCITYLSYSVFGDGPVYDDEELEDRLSKYPFFRYAAQYWGDHANEEPARTSAIEDLALELLQDEGKLGSANQVMELTDTRHPGYSLDFVRCVNGLHIAAYFGLHHIIQRLLPTIEDINTKDEDGRTALHRAAEHGHNDAVIALVNHGAELNEREYNYDQTPLHLAALNGNGPVVQTLLQKGAEAEVKDGEGWMAIHVAAWTGNEEVIRVLLEKTAVYARSRDNLTALHCAAAQGHVGVAQLLIREGADVDANDADGWTPLHWASKKRHDVMKPRILTLKEEASTLLRKIFDIEDDLKEAVRQQAIAVQEGLTTVKNTLDKWQNKLSWLPPEIKLNVHQELLGGMQITTNSHSMVLALPSYWEKPDKKEDEERKRKEEAPTPVRFIFAIQDELTAMHCSVECGHEQVALLLLKNGATIDRKATSRIETKLGVDFEVETEALHLAAFSGHEAMVRLLLKHKANIHAKTNPSAHSSLHESLAHASWSVLHCAVVSGNAEVVKLFLAGGVNINESCSVQYSMARCQFTALQLAAILGQDAVIEELVSHGAEIGASGNIFVDQVMRRKDEIFFEKILDVTALHLAAMFGRFGALKLLVEKKADIESKLDVRTGYIDLQLTALQIATIRKQHEAVEFLLEHGADVHVEVEPAYDQHNRAQLSAMHLAMLSQNEALPQLLFRWGANINSKCHIDVDITELSEEPEEDATQTPNAAEHEDSSTEEQSEEPTQSPLAAFMKEKMADFPIVGNLFKPKKRARELTCNIHIQVAPLHMALMLGNLDVVQSLIDQEADVDTMYLINVNQAFLGIAPLHLAVLQGHEKAARALLDAGADTSAMLQITVGRSFEVKLTALQLAAISGNDELVQLLLDAGVDSGQGCCINDRTDGTPNALHFAALCGRENMVKLLIDQGIDPFRNFRMEFDSGSIIEIGLLHLAAISGREETVKLLINTGLDTRAAARLDWLELNVKFTVQHLAVLWKHENIVQLLLEQDHDFDASLCVSYGSKLQVEFPTLHLAAISGAKTTVQMLLDAGVNTRQNAILRAGSIHTELTALHIAGFANDWDLTGILAASDVDVHENIKLGISKTQIEFSLLHTAMASKPDRLRMLLDNGFDIHAKMQIDTPDKHAEFEAIHLAVAMVRNDLLHTLVDYEAGAGSRLQILTDKFNLDVSALHIAVARKDCLQVKFPFFQRPPRSRHSSSYFEYDDVHTVSDRSASSNDSVRPSRRRWRAQSRSWSRPRSRSRPPSPSPSRPPSQPRSRSESRQASTSRTPGRPPPDARAFSFRNRRSNPFPFKAREDLNQTQEADKDAEGQFINGSIPHSRRNSEGNKEEFPYQPSESLEADESLEWYILECPEDPDAMGMLSIATTSVWFSPLHVAMIFRSNAALGPVLKKGADPNLSLKASVGTMHLEAPPLHLAVLYGSEVLVDSLIENGADIEHALQLKAGGLRVELSALHTAAVVSSVGLAELLLDKHRHPYTKCPVKVTRRLQTELTLLHLMVFSKDSGIASTLGKMGMHAKYLADLEFSSEFEITPMDIACAMKDESMMAILSERGMEKMPDFDQRGSKEGLGALMSIMVAFGTRRNWFLSRTLEDNIDAKGTLGIKIKADGMFMSHTRAGADAAFMNHTQADADTMFMSHGQADTEAKLDVDLGVEMSGLHLAVSLGDERMMGYLLRHGAYIEDKCKISVQDIFDAELTSLHLATLWKNERVARMLLDEHADVRATARVNIDQTIRAGLVTPQVATFFGDGGVLRLLKADSEVRFRIEAGLTALHIAALADDDAFARLLIERGLDANAYSQATVEVETTEKITASIKVSLSALHLAASTGHERVGRVLLKMEADPDLAIQVGGTAHFEKGARITRTIKAGGTALHLAAGFGHLEMVQLLIEYGADARAKSQDGRTAFEWAKDRGHDDVAELILERLRRDGGTIERGRLRQKWRDIAAKATSVNSPGGEGDNSKIEEDKGPKPGTCESKRPSLLRSLLGRFM